MPYRLEIVVFVSGAAVMMLEIVASRILAPYFGTSTFVWTSLIGVILASLSAGYYWGGKLADRRPQQRLLAALLFGSALFIALAVALQFVTLSIIQKLGLDLRLAAVLSALILFGPASIMLGMVSPLAARLRMDAVVTAGATLGRLYALSTLGSIVGTFAAGFWLIALVGSVTLLLLIAGLLLLTSLLLAVPADRPKAVVGLVLIAAAAIFHIDYAAYARSNGFIDVDTHYSRVWIYDEQNRSTNRTMRFLMFDPFGIQSMIYVDDPSDSVKESRYGRPSRLYISNPARILAIGGAAYTVTRDLISVFPEARIDVVEIDPALTEIAKKYFFLKEDPRLSIIHEDGRTFLNRSDETYDLLFVDAFSSSSSIPFQLVSKEAFELYKSHLNPGGVLMVNSIGRVQGAGHEFTAGLHATMSSVFPRVDAFAGSDASNLSLRQNLVFIGLPDNREVNFDGLDTEMKAIAERRVAAGLSGPNTTVFTDDFAPAELYISQMVSSASKGQ